MARDNNLGYGNNGEKDATMDYLQPSPTGQQMGLLDAVHRLNGGG